jgi:hypothetical protein
MVNEPKFGTSTQSSQEYIDKKIEKYEKAHTESGMTYADQAVYDQLTEALHGSKYYTNANDADKTALDALAVEYINRNNAGWNAGKKGIEEGVFSEAEYLKFMLELQKADEANGANKSYSKDEQLQAIDAMGWSDQTAAKYWPYLQSTAKNPFLETEKKTETKKTETVETPKEEETTPSWRKEAKKNQSTDDWIKSMTHPEEEKKQERQTGTVQSSWLSGYDWDPQTGTLQIQANGRWYTHHVTQEMFDAFMAAPSKGSYYSRVIKYY